jgi:hypothetical protein
MAGYSVKPASIFGRIGTEVGKGLAEEVPKIQERKMLSQGLEALGKQKNLTPFEQFAKLSSIPGITPQMLQSGAELLKQQGTFEGVGRGRNREGMPQQQGPSASQGIRDVQFQGGQRQQPQPQNQTQQGLEGPVEPTNNLVPNPTRPEAQTKAPWTTDRRNDEIDSLHQQYPGLTFPEINAMASENEARELAQPLAVQQRDERLKGIQTDIDDRFDKSLKRKLQKGTEGEVYKDVTGEMLENARRIMERQLIENPSASPDDVVDTMTTKLLDVAKTKDQLRKDAGSNIFATPLLLNRGGLKKKLESYQKLFKDTGNLEEYWNTLQSDFNLSPQGASSVAFPRSKEINSYIEKVKPAREDDYASWRTSSMKHASEIGNHITADDSLLAIARDIKRKDPTFDQAAFFEQLQADQDQIRFTARQRRELAEGASPDLLPTWADILILP